MNFIGKAKRLEDIDLPMIGREIGVGEDEVHAILDAESAGSGFDAKGRPKMLFEPHIFWRELGPGPKRDAAAKAGLAYARWKSGAYPKDSYPRLQQAIAIDEKAALRSASWGLGQVMGFNHAAAGWTHVHQMVEDFMDDEEWHLRAMVNFIKTNKLDDELRRHDWVGFARGYNGAGFAKNGYDKKLAASFARWQKIKDTPLTSKPVDDSPTPNPPATAPRAVPTSPAPQKPAKPRTGPVLAVGGIGVLIYAAWDTLAGWWAIVNPF